MNRRCFHGFHGLTLTALALTACTSTGAYRVDFGGVSGADGTPKGTVVMLLTAANEQTLSDGRTRETGYFLNEAYAPYRALRDAGYSVRVSTIGGQVPAVDPESLDEKYGADPAELADARAWAQSQQVLSPEAVETVAAAHEAYQGLIVPGGQGVMVDLLDDDVVHSTLAAFAANDRPVGLICHAPAILASMDAVPSAFVGRHVTSVSGFEEWYIERFVMGAHAEVRGIGDRLDDAGFEYDHAGPGRSNAVRDCSLVTSQNPFSSERFNTLFLEAMEDWRRGGRCVEDEG